MKEYNWKHHVGHLVSGETPEQARARKIHEEAKRRATAMEMTRLLFMDGTELRFHGLQEPLGDIEVIGGLSQE